MLDEKLYSMIDFDFSYIVPPSSRVRHFACIDFEILPLICIDALFDNRDKLKLTFPHRIDLRYNRNKMNVNMGSKQQQFDGITV